VRHPEVEEAEKGWRIADVKIRQARIKHRGMPSQENAAALNESEDRWEQAMTVWEDKVKDHGTPSDRLSLVAAGQLRLKKPIS
jgi:hypothetical protein